MGMGQGMMDDNVMASYRPDGKVDYVCMYVSYGAHICYAGIGDE